MARHPVQDRDVPGTTEVIRRLHGLVTHGPGDLDIAWAMSTSGYDAVRWAEGQGMLAELVSSETPERNTLIAATAWYDEAATVARDVLAAQPRLLDKLGLIQGDKDYASG